jgi:hypothetical protein
LQLNREGAERGSGPEVGTVAFTGLFAMPDRIHTGPPHKR